MAVTISDSAVCADLQQRFDAAMDRFAPFENRPHLAVAVSGGPASLALAVLAKHWVDARFGRLTALIVDHGLRPESSDEARQVHAQLRTRGIAAEVLTWLGDKPAGGVQAAARTARYRLLGHWCREHGVLHLLAGHHADDQQETIAMRRARRSGAVGLAGMSAIVEGEGGRLLRPLLGLRRADLRAFLAIQGISWIDDPSNRDERFERTRLRRAPAPARGSVAVGDAARRRQAHERRVLSVLARAASLHPFGFCTLDVDALQTETAEIASGALARVVAWVGGRAYPPGPDATDRLRARILDQAPGRSATLAGCLVARRRGTLEITREPGRLPPSTPLSSRSAMWDGRFWVTVPGTENAPPAREIGPLGRQGWVGVQSHVAPDLVVGVPTAAIWALPALWIEGVPVGVPQLLIKCPATVLFSAVFRPRCTLFSPTFAVA